MSLWSKNEKTLKAAVTGGAGFIGSHLVDRLLSDGLKVIALDNLATGRMENLSAARAFKNFQFHEVDINDPGALACLQGVDWLFHLAGLADIVPSIEQPQLYHRANVDGTIRVLEQARQSGVKRFVYAASSSCYGLPDQMPTSESADIRPMYPYALTKSVGEQYMLHWSKVYGLPTVSLRLFNVFGLRHRTSGTYGAVFGVFLAQKLAGKPFTVVGDGKQVRDFVFVTDVVDAFVKAAASDVTGQVYNVGSGRPQSVNRLAELLGGKKIHLPKRPGEPDATHADITRITRELGWRPTVGFDEGVAVMLANIEAWRQAPVWSAESIAVATKQWFTHLGR